MNDILPTDLRMRFTSAVLIDVDGDVSHLAGPLVEVVDVRVCPHTGSTHTILHVPGGQLPCEVRRAMGITYETSSAGWCYRRFEDACRDFAAICAEGGAYQCAAFVPPATPDGLLDAVITASEAARMRHIEEGALGPGPQVGIEASYGLFGWSAEFYSASGTRVVLSPHFDGWTVTIRGQSESVERRSAAVGRPSEFSLA